MSIWGDSYLGDRKEWILVGCCCAVCPRRRTTWRSQTTSWRLSKFWICFVSRMSVISHPYTVALSSLSRRTIMLWLILPILFRSIYISKWFWRRWFWFPCPESSENLRCNVRARAGRDAYLASSWGALQDARQWTRSALWSIGCACRRWMRLVLGPYSS